MNGGFLLLPFFAVRFLLLSALNREAVPRAARFAPMEGREKAAYCVYQLSNAGIFLSLFFLPVKTGRAPLFCLGLLCYLLGLALCAASVVDFSSPDSTGLNTRGLYQFSRNPMYGAYFVCFVGMALLTRSLVLLGMVLAFQVSAHWIILAEERWCLKKFGDAYAQYSRRVRRYIGRYRPS